MDESFEIIGPIRETEIIAAGTAVRSRIRLPRSYGAARWRKIKGIALIRYIGERICEAELHWYEAHGRGKYEFKVRRELS